MSDDLVARLRARAEHHTIMSRPDCWSPISTRLFREAADEIERLRAETRNAQNWLLREHCEAEGLCTCDSDEMRAQLPESLWGMGHIHIRKEGKDA